jgi:tetratricopeptide (TPR) repeat protein
MGAPYLHGYDPLALLLVALIVVFGAVALGIAAHRHRRQRPRWLKSVSATKRVDLVVRALDRLAESKADLLGLDPEARQSFQRGLAAMAACRWDEAVGHFAAAQELVSGPRLAPLLHQTGVCRYMQGRLAEALKDFQESGRLAEQREDQLGRALVLNNLGVIRRDYGELDIALRDLRKARVVTRESGDLAVEALCVGNIGNVLRDRGEHNAALKLQEDALAMARQVGDWQGVASSLSNIGTVLHDKGELDQALERYKAAVEAARRVSYKLGMAVVLGNIGALYSDRGDPDRALKSHESALALAREIGYQLGIATELANIGLVMVAKRTYDRAVAFLADSFTFLLNSGTTKGRLQTLYGLSRCDDALGRERMVALLQRAGLSADAVADTLDRVDLMRSRRPWQKGVGRNPFAPVPPSPQLSGA